MTDRPWARSSLERLEGTPIPIEGGSTPTYLGVTLAFD